MKDDLKDILSNLNPDVDQAMLLKYLSGQLTPEEQHEVEKRIMEDDFNTEALEGLEQIKNSQHLDLVVEQLNRDLKKKTEKRKAARNKWEIKSDPALWIAIAVILILVVVSYFLIHRSIQP
jgi:anti-sigma factor RsiW